MITGGAGAGIGNGLSEALAEAGWSIAIVERDRPAAEKLAEKLVAGGAAVEVIVADVTDAAAPETAVRKTLERFGRLDGLVNSVGVGLLKKAGDVSDTEMRSLFEVNFFAAVRFARAALPALTKTEGAIVNIGSVHAATAARNFAIYAATKAALEAFTRGLAMDYGPVGVRANIVHPGLVESPQNSAFLSTMPDPQAWLVNFAATKQCIPRLTTARDVGELVAFLLGKKARTITGQNIFADGGTTTMMWNNETAP